MKIARDIAIGTLLVYWLVSLVPAFFDGLFGLYYIARLFF